MSEGPDNRSGPPPAGWLGPVRGAGPIVAWIAAVACGLKAAGLAWDSPGSGPAPDLLSAVLHGAAAWVGVLVIWLAGCSACERLLAARPAAEREGHLEPAMNADERR